MYDHTIEPGDLCCRADGSVFAVTVVELEKNETGVLSGERQGFILGRAAWPCPEKPTQAELDEWNCDLSGECRLARKDERYASSHADGLRQAANDRVRYSSRDGGNVWILRKREPVVEPERNCKDCQHCEVPYGGEPCRHCSGTVPGSRDLTLWQPKTPEPERSCETCKFYHQHMVAGGSLACACCCGYNGWQPKTPAPIKLGPENLPREAKFRKPRWAGYAYITEVYEDCVQLGTCQVSWSALCNGAYIWNLPGMAPDEWLPMGVFPKESGE